MSTPSDACIAAFERQYDTTWADPALRNERLSWIACWKAASACQGCAVQQGYVPVGAVAQIQDASRLPEIKDMLNSPQTLNNNDRAFWVLGWNECRDAAKSLIAHIAELEAQLAAVQQGVPASVIAGAIFDFAGYLTTLPAKDVIHCSEVHAASPMVKAIDEWANKRDLFLDDARVTNWRDALATQPTTQGLDALTQAARDVMAERARQISGEGWTPEHDDQHDEGEMCFAAAGYAALASDHMQAIVRGMDEHLTMEDSIPTPSAHLRPWPVAWEFKPCTPRRALVKAGALIQAEIERIDRSIAAQAKQGGV